MCNLLYYVSIPGICQVNYQLSVITNYLRLSPDSFSRKKHAVCFLKRANCDLKFSAYERVTEQLKLFI